MTLVVQHQNRHQQCCEVSVCDLTMIDAEQEDASGSGDGASQHDEHCTVCHLNDDCDMLLCDGCPKVFHLTCLGLSQVPDGDWYCAVCSDEAATDS